MYISNVTKVFYKDKDIVKAVKIVGDAETSAALQVLHNISYERDKKAAINRALTHLESAFHIYAKT